MTPVTKIVFLGASSASFGISMFRDLFSSHDLTGSTLILVGRNVDRLKRAERLAKLLNEKSGAGLKIECTTDWRAAFDGAEFVIHSTAIDRNRLWKLDFEVPRKFGIRHTLGENGGPGGLFFTLRTLPVVFEFIREMELRCPRALFINFSNPESRIVLALGQYSKISHHGPVPRNFPGAKPGRLHPWLACRTGGGVGRGPESFSVSHAGARSEYRRRPLSAVARKGKKPRPVGFAADAESRFEPLVIGSAAATPMSANTCHLAGKPAKADTISNGTKASGRRRNRRSTTCFQERRRFPGGG